MEEADWKKAKSLDIAGPANAALVVKVLGRNPEWTARTITLTSGITPQNVVFYFAEARSVAIERMVIPGTAVAPQADVSLLGGEISVRFTLAVTSMATRPDSILKQPLPVMPTPAAPSSTETPPGPK
ncbi:MAG: choice-of-anchor A family protein [Bdellovibrionota bacterium]